MDSIAIPHNSNGSDGYMFSNKTYDGAEIDKDYAALRMRNEPIVEVSQVKGTSETHPLQSPNDEWAAFEIMPYQIATWNDSKIDGSYVRQFIGAAWRCRRKVKEIHINSVLFPPQTRMCRPVLLMNMTIGQNRRGRRNRTLARFRAPDMDATIGGTGFPSAKLVAANQYAGRPAHRISRQKSGPGLFAHAMVKLGRFRSRWCVG